MGVIRDKLKARKKEWQLKRRGTQKSIKIELSEKQQFVFQDSKDKENIILSGGYGSGKSDLAIYIFLQCVEQQPINTRAIAIHYSLSSMRDRLNEFFFKWSLPTINKTSSQFVYKDRIINLYGAENIRQFQKIRSANAFTLYVEEASMPSFQEATLQESISRIRGAKGVPLKKIIATNPPSPTSWLKKNYIDDKDNWTTYTFSTFDNPFIDVDKYIKDLGILYSDKTSYLYRRMILGEIVPNQKALFSIIKVGEVSIPSNRSIGCLDPSYGGKDYTSLTFGILNSETYHLSIKSYCGDNFEQNKIWMVKTLRELELDTLYVETNGDHGLLAEFLSQRLPNTQVIGYRTSMNKQRKILRVLGMYADKIILDEESDRLEKVLEWGEDQKDNDDEIDSLASWFLVQEGNLTYEYF